MIRVRFNLGQGENYLKWQIKDAKSVDYYDPNDVTIIMTNAKLRNRSNVAKKIHEGSNKEVCAWIECSSAKVIGKIDLPVSSKKSYNPRVSPNWIDDKGLNIDGETYSSLVTIGKGVFEKQTIF